MFGSIAGAESLVVALNDGYQPDLVMTEAPHGTAPRFFGRNIANPMAMILPGRSPSWAHAGGAAAASSRAVYDAVFAAVHDGIRTADIGGAATTSEFTDEVIRRVRVRLAV